MCHNGTRFSSAHLPLPPHDNCRSPVIPNPSEDRIHGPGCPCDNGTNPSRHGTTLCTSAHTRSVYSHVPPRSHVLKIIPNTIRSPMQMMQMQYSRLLHLLRNKLHPTCLRRQISQYHGNRRSLVLAFDVRTFSSLVHSQMLSLSAASSCLHPIANLPLTGVYSRPVLAAPRLAVRHAFPSLPRVPLHYIPV